MRKIINYHKIKYIHEKLNIDKKSLLGHKEELLIIVTKNYYMKQ